MSTTFLAFNMAFEKFVNKNAVNIKNEGSNSLKMIKIKSLKIRTSNKEL